MPKTKISEFDVDPANNTDINSINIAEGCAPSGINNAIRQLMSDLKEFQTGAGGDPFNGAVNGTVGATTANTGAFTTLSATGVTTVSAGSVSAPAITTTGDTNTGIFFPAADTIAFAEGGSESMRIDSSGNLGIGTAIAGAITPSIRLGNSGSGGGVVTATLSLGSYSTGYGSNLISSSDFSTSSASYLAFGTTPNGASGLSAPVERMRIDSSGNLNIATGGAALQWSNASNNCYIAASSGNLQFATGTGGYVERMRIDSSGNVLVGTTSRINFCKVGIAADATTNNILVIQNTSGTNAGNFALFANSAGATAGLINQTGAATVAFVTTSDYRLKENIAPMTGALDKVSALKPVTYTWKVDGSVGQGFIAHELQAVVPDCVVGKKDELDFDGKIKPQGIDTSFLVATLTAAIQELKAEVDALKAQINQ